MKKILIVSEVFTCGGLETQIAGGVRFLVRNGIECHLLCREYKGDETIPFERVVKNVNFSDTLRNYEILEIVDDICDYVKSNEIDMIHLHPFHTVLPTVLAGEKCKVPVVYTIHGPGTIHFLNTYINGELLNNYLNGRVLNYLLLREGIDRLFPVAKYLEAETHFIINNKNTNVLINAVDTDVFVESLLPNNQHWAFVSRVEHDKIIPILSLLNILEKTAIRRLDIYGDGHYQGELEQFIKDKRLDDKVRLLGRSDKLHQDLLNRYDGVIGMGRVVLESLSMNIPAVILSYKGVIAGVTIGNVFRFAELNFSGRGERALQDNEIVQAIEDIRCNPEKYQLREVITDNFSEEKVWGDYLNIVEKIEYSNKPVIEELYYMIKGMNGSEDVLDSEELHAKLSINYPDDGYQTSLLREKNDNLISQIHVLEQRNEELFGIKEDLETKKGDLEVQKRDLETQKRDLESQKKDLETQKRESDIKAQNLSNNLNDVYLSRTWKAANGMKTIARKTGVLLLVKGLMVFKRKGLRGVMNGIQKYSSINKEDDLNICEVDSDVIDKIGKELAGKKVVVFPPTVDWHMPLFQRPQQLAQAYAKKDNIAAIYLTANIAYDKTKVIQQLDNDLWLINQDYFSAFAPTVEKNAKQTIFSISWTPNIIYLEKMKADKVIYEYIDEIEIFHQYGEQMEADHRFLLQNSDLAVCTATKLYEQAIGLAKKPILSTNGVDYDFFAKTTETPMNDLLKSKIESYDCVLGYYGALASWFDYELVAMVAEEKPNWVWVLVGLNYDGSLDKSGILDIPNIIYIPPQDYKTLPSFLTAFDIATIPFVINEITLSTSPVKLFEYMAGGKPILASRMPECLKYRSAHCYSNSKDFIELAEELLNLGEKSLYWDVLREEALANTWEAKTDEILRGLEVKK